MFKVGVDAREVNAAIDNLFSAIDPIRVTMAAMRASKEKVKKGYQKKWELARLGKASGWQSHKRQAKFPSGIGFFTGATFRGIDYQMLVEGERDALGEVSVYGKWPDDGIITNRVGYFTLSGEDPRNYGARDRGYEDTPDIEPGYYTEEYDPDTGAYSRDQYDVVSSYFSGGVGVSGADPGVGVIAVGPNKVVIRYPNSKPMIKKSQLMRTMHYGPEGKSVDFMYLNDNEVRRVVDSVIEHINVNIKD